MALSSDILSAFAKITVEADKPNTAGTVVNGTAKAYAGGMYVQLDGSDQLTPITSSTAGMKDGDRVTVLIKDHKTTVTGNVSSPSVTTDEFEDTKTEIGSKIEEFENVIADTVTTEQLEAESARIDDLVTENLAVKDRLTATEADITDLTANKASITELEAAKAEIDQLEANMITAEAADLKYATIANLEATNANIHNLQADYGEFEELATGKFTAIEADISELDAEKLSAEEADLLYANIDFTNIGVAAVEELFAKSGIIGDLVVSEGHITGHLVGVTISGDLIEGNTIKADKLVVLGDDGLYYKLNVSGESVAAEQTQYNSLNGSIITANTITAEKINVDDLVAFNATIGGFHIDDHALYSGAKASVDNATRGTYMDDDGQFVIGDNNNYLKFFLDETDSKWKLQLSAESIKMGASGTSLEEEVEAAQDSAANASESAQDAMNEISNVRSEMNILTESISTLVTDGNGGSLMEQTENGWTFNIGAIQSQLNNAVNSITDIQGDLNEKETVINAINGLVDDIAEKTAYINMTTDDGGSPCIELGESTSDFKLRITNTSIDFMQGTNRIAYITNESLYIQSSVVTDDFKIGSGAGFIWKRRSNGNMGLRWEAN